MQPSGYYSSITLLSLVGSALIGAGLIILFNPKIWDKWPAAPLALIGPNLLLGGIVAVIAAIVIFGLRSR